MPITGFSRIRKLSGASEHGQRMDIDSDSKRMKPEFLLSGLPKADCRSVLGEAAWSIVGASWRDPMVLLAAGDGATGDVELVWFYRSPAIEVLRSGPDRPVAEVLDAWAERNGKAMDLGRNGMKRLVAVNLDARLNGDLSWLSPALAGIMPHQSPVLTLDAGLVEALEWLLHRCAPRTREVYVSLENAALIGRRFESENPGGEGESLFSLMEAVRHNAIFMSPRVAGALVAGESERYKMRSEQLAIQLQQVREELDLCYGRAKKLELEVADLQAAQPDAGQSKWEEESLLFQLQNLQEELECQHEFLQKQLQSLEVLRVERADMEEENKVLRMRIEILRMEADANLAEPVRADATLSGWTGIRAALRRRIPARSRGRERASPAGSDERTHDLATLAGSKWFDRDWYLLSYPDVHAAGMDPVEHFHDFGWSEQRDPGPGFSTRYYLDAYPDVASSGMDPLLHFVRHGLKEGRLPRKP